MSPNVFETNDNVAKVLVDKTLHDIANEFVKTAHVKIGIRKCGQIKQSAIERKIFTIISM